MNNWFNIIKPAKKSISDALASIPDAISHAASEIFGTSSSPSRAKEKLETISAGPSRTLMSAGVQGPLADLTLGSAMKRHKDDLPALDNPLPKKMAVDSPSDSPLPFAAPVIQDAIRKASQQKASSTTSARTATSDFGHVIATEGALALKPVTTAKKGMPSKWRRLETALTTPTVMITSRLISLMGDNVSRLDPILSRDMSIKSYLVLGYNESGHDSFSDVVHPGVSHVYGPMQMTKATWTDALAKGKELLSYRPETQTAVKRMMQKALNYVKNSPEVSNEIKKRLASDPDFRDKYINGPTAILGLMSLINDRIHKEWTFSDSKGWTLRTPKQAGSLANHLIATFPKALKDKDRGYMLLASAYSIRGLYSMNHDADKYDYDSRFTKDLNTLDSITSEPVITSFLKQMDAL